MVVFPSVTMAARRSGEWTGRARESSAPRGRHAAMAHVDHHGRCGCPYSRGLVSTVAWMRIERVSAPGRESPGIRGPQRRQRGISPWSRCRPESGVLGVSEASALEAGIAPAPGALGGARETPAPEAGIATQVEPAGRAAAHRALPRPPRSTPPAALHPAVHRALLRRVQRVAEREKAIAANGRSGFCGGNFSYQSLPCWAVGQGLPPTRWKGPEGPR
jgi:hypothetical protein